MLWRKTTTKQTNLPLWLHQHPDHAVLTAMEVLHVDTEQRLALNLGRELARGSSLGEAVVAFQHLLKPHHLAVTDERVRIQSARRWEQREVSRSQWLVFTAIFYIFVRLID